MTTKNTIIALVIVAAASAGLTRFYFPKVEFKSVETTKEGSKGETKNDIKTVIRYIERPDGSKETVTETTDKSTKKESTKKETSKEVIIASKSQWLVGIGAGLKLSDKDLVYKAQVSRRIAGPFFLGVDASATKTFNDKTVGVFGTMEF
jgi:hypothetical protein